MKRMFSAVLLVGAMTSAAMAAEAYKIDKSHSEASFRIRHLMSRVTGRFTDFDGLVNIDRKRPLSSSVAFTIRTASIDTGEPNRDNHLRSAEFFEVDKYPELKFQSTSIKAVGKDTYDVKGNLTMRGVTKPVTVRVDYLGAAKDPMGNERAGFEVTTKLNRKDYGIVWNKSLDAGGYLLDDVVQVMIEIQAVKQKAGATATGR